METIFQLFLTTVQIGSVYVLFALGLTIIFGVLKIVNFAHGQFFTMSALVVAVVIPWLTAQGLSLFAAYGLGLLAGIALATGFGVLAYQVGFRWFQRDLVGSFILSAGLVLLFEGAYLEIFGGAVRSVPPLVEGTVSILGAGISAQRLLICIIAVLLTAGLTWALAKTRFGNALRAVSIDHEAAMLQGIPYKSIAFSGFVFATLIGAVAGALIAPVSSVSPTFGDSFLIKGFIAVVIGGLGSVPGAIIGSLLIAAIEAFGGFYFDPSSASLAIFVLVMLMLLVRPNGVLGRG
ncbi:branched-chain amino acid transport system permease protein [Pseudomonas citronellolis]|uniref:Branched-chain amino acid transport system permease protein n=1 Tax=Pseudomonas citronellolis TaxID=53408 RepID=A0AAQ1KNU4_9PSED|nr:MULTISPECIES: branched-chain amino acid ABC transporter permease [Pseudomonas]MCL6692432.1 branched-chain amino acid ABC transporter permease [Pseudomonas sp. R3.Fl]MCP1606051.1 branched-chain amino acid transport system permease protein [Pseudomonas citronellolis]MCP1656539.1 branched-chain amino acid transport system permease protein [Pseudomonas citronellolis]MCP1723568.1 branched-chain amino acid transport system permease protein [Pseudomonas citronellolis]MDN6876682.1 branched-chain am